MADSLTFIRTEMLLGSAAMERLKKSRVAVFGVGGVGGYVVEALARSGIGALDLFDGDCVAVSNLNRQILATRSTVGMPKVEAAERRVRDISPETVVSCHRMFVLPENIGEINFSAFNYVVDAIDTVSGKLAIISAAKAAGVPVISAMGAGNKLDPSAFRVSDIAKTSACPLARVMRIELRKRGISGVKAVWSDETPRRPLPEIAEKSAAAERSEDDGDATGGNGKAAFSRRATPGSVSFVPGVAGLIAAGEVIRDLAGDADSAL